MAQSNPSFEIWLYYHIYDSKPTDEEVEKVHSFKEYVNSKISGGFNFQIHPVFLEDAIGYFHVKKSTSPSMKTFMRTIKDREEDMLNYYETFVTNAAAESLNSGIKGFRAELHGVSNLPFFFYRVCKIYG